MAIVLQGAPLLSWFCTSYWEHTCYLIFYCGAHRIHILLAHFSSISKTLFELLGSHVEPLFKTNIWLTFRAPLFNSAIADIYSAIAAHLNWGGVLLLEVFILVASVVLRAAWQLPSCIHYIFAALLTWGGAVLLFFPCGFSQVGWQLMRCCPLAFYLRNPPIYERVLAS